MSTSSQTCKVVLASGEPVRGASARGDFTAAQAARVVQEYEWAWIDADGDIVVSMYRTRCGADQHTPVRGREMAARLRRRDQRGIYAALERKLGRGNPGYNWQNG